MVVLVIHEFDIRPGKTKCHAPITVYRYRPMAVQIALQLMQLQFRQIQLDRCLGCVQ